VDGKQKQLLPCLIIWAVCATWPGSVTPALAQAPAPQPPGLPPASAASLGPQQPEDRPSIAHPTAPLTEGQLQPPELPEQDRPDAHSLEARGADSTSGQWTLSQLEQWALRNNPAVAQARARWLAAQGQYVQAGLYPNPTVGYLGVEFGQENRAGQQGAFVSQELITAGKRRWRQAVAAQQMRYAESILAAAQLRVLTDVHVAFYQTLIADRKVVLAAELVRQAEETIKATKGLLEAAEASRLDLLQAELEAESARQVLAEAQRDLEAKCRMLAALVGIDTLSASDLAGDFEQLPEPLEWQQVVSRIVSQSPELAAAEAALRQARYELVLACREAVPNVEVEVDVQHDNSSTSNFASVIISVPLPLLDRNQGNIASAQAELAAAERQVERTRLDLQSRLADAFARYQSARAQAERYRNVILPKTDELYRLSRKAYEQGQIGYLNLLMVARSFVQTHLDYLNVLSAAHTEAARIDGLLLESSLSADL